MAFSYYINPNGRLIHFSRSTGKLTVLIDELWFANGVALSPNEDFVLVCDLFRNKILQYWLKADKAGAVRTFAEGLPGIVDNLTPDETGFYAALPYTMDPDHVFFPHSITNLPLFRKFVARLLGLTELFINTLDDFYPSDFLKTTCYNLVHNLGFRCSERATILRFDWEGNVVASYHAYDGSGYTHAMKLDGWLYLGSFFHNYIARVPIEA